MYSVMWSAQCMTVYMLRTLLHFVSQDHLQKYNNCPPMWHSTEGAEEISAIAFMSVYVASHGIAGYLCTAHAMIIAL